MRKRLAALILATAALLGLAACGPKGPGADTDYVRRKGYLTVGVTSYKPMDYQDENGEWIGFDADMARAFAENLGVGAVFVEIDWDSKEQELEERDIDVVWNGMTLTEEVQRQMAVSAPYCRNAQVVVVPAQQARAYRREDSLRGLDFVAEDGSAGADALADIGLVCTPVSSQAVALAQVAEGNAAACVIDQFMAAASVGPESDYPQLAVAAELGGAQAEEIVVGFRRGSDLPDVWAQFWAQALADGTVDAAAQRYGMDGYLIRP